MGAYLFGECRFAAGEQHGKLEASGLATDSTVAAIAESRDSLRRVIEAQAKVFAGDSLRLETSRQSAERAAARWKAVAQGFDSFVPRVVFDSTAAAFDSLVAEERAGRLEAERRAMFWHREYLTADTLLLAYEIQIADLTTQRDTWKRQARPGLGKRIGGALPWMAAAYLLGAITR